MTGTWSQIRSFDRPIRLLLINQLGINIGFYMLMPYLASYLSVTLGLAAWLVGFVLGVRNLSQQGLFLLGGSLADRFGYKPMILAGLALRTAGFALLGFAETIPVLIIASALTGFAGALFNPAVRAYVAAEAGERRVDAFAVFNIFYQLGILLGPLIGLALLAIDFTLVCAVAAAVFLLLTVLQARALPARTRNESPDIAGPEPAGDRETNSKVSHTGRGGEAPLSIIRSWRVVLANQSFLLFALAMIGSYVLTFQVYLGLPIEVRRATGSETGVTLLFVLSGLLTVAGQVRLTMWVKARWTPGQAMSRGLILMGLAFLPLVLSASFDQHGAEAAARSLPAQALAMVPVLTASALLAVATMLVYPFEMATIVTLGGDRMMGTYYGLYNTLSGIGIAAGNLLTGAALDAGRNIGISALPWIILALTGGLCATSVHRLDRAGRLAPPQGVTVKPETSRPRSASRAG
ncbi:MFS transporter [Pseudofrankia sp. BMG5.37]|uniref:MDR family MFS transporter n=1 Tax=Pseudofrankia sp. BMG5.37 TaxID=3050035 RepID=UPI002893B2C4|nr:MFS transporter [Pseudofrankia sp. BMG5.37]MDT3442675.1 MFS transporter [Pseudofrankia sp. BMG5.37]